MGWVVSVACNCQKLQRHFHYKCIVALAAIALAIRKHFIHFFLIRVWFEFCANNNNIASPIKVGNKDVSLTKHDFIAHSFNFSPLRPIIKMAKKNSHSQSCKQHHHHNHGYHPLDHNFMEPGLLSTR